MKKLIKKLTLVLLMSLGLTSCGGDPETSTVKVTTIVKETIDPMNDKGIGPISSLELNATINQTISSKGEKIFTGKCSACHKLDKRFIGPALEGVTKRRTPEWIMNMILNPEQMVKENAQAKQLLMEYISPMANQSLTKDEARSILEYFRNIDKGL